MADRILVFHRGVTLVRSQLSDADPCWLHPRPAVGARTVPRHRGSPESAGPAAAVCAGCRACGDACCALRTRAPPSLDP